MKTPLTQALEWIEERYEIIIPKNKKQEFVESEERAIKEAWEEGNAIGDIGIIITSADKYYEQNYKNDTGSR